MIIILNAPPACGKDTIANLLVQNFAFEKRSFKTQVFKIALAMANMKPEKFFARYNDRNLKEKPWALLGGLSCREFMIHISENVMKPLYGNDIFGKQMVQACEPKKDYYVVADGGFQEEIEPLVKAGHKVFIFRLHRDTYSFEGDSRSYLKDIDGAIEFDLQLITGKPNLAVNTIVNLAMEHK